MNNSGRILQFLFLFISLFLILPQPIHAEDKIIPPVKFDYESIAGEWQRTDGGYLFKISDVQVNGQAKVEYFNPRPIHVAESIISMKKELIKLFVTLQDTGYEGSTYTLFYYAEKDALAGFYYQATTDRTYEVVFVRKSN